jgi:hypothetical protein
MKNAIVCLTRGYSHVNNYYMLIQRNNLIYHHLNEKMNKHYQSIIFHEGNISKEHQDFILEHSQDKTIQFVDVSSIWTGGYAGMCKFNMYDIWNYTKEYDFILRVDEDCFISKIEIDPFSCIDDKVFLISAPCRESHEATNATLPQFIESITNVPASLFYDHKFPYTNVCISSVQFWREPPVSSILKQIAFSELQHKNRWGDLPVLGSLLNIYAKDRVGNLKQFEYYHESHKETINCK